MRIRVYIHLTIQFICIIILFVDKLILTICSVSSSYSPIKKNWKKMYCKECRNTGTLSCHINSP